MAPVTLRVRAPYTCRFVIAGKVCAAYLGDDDGDFCKPHAQAVARFQAGPLRASHDEEPAAVRVIPSSWPIWPGAERGAEEAY